MPIKRETVVADALNHHADLPYSLRVEDFAMAMQDVYDFFKDVNERLQGKGLSRLDDMLRPAAMSGIISDMITASLARHSRVLVENKYFNGHPDLVQRGMYPNDSTKSGVHGIEIKSTRKKGGAVDTHGAREQWMCVFIYETDNKTEPAVERAPMRFTEVYLAYVTEADFRENARGKLGTRTATLHKAGVASLRQKWIYRLTPPKQAKKKGKAGAEPTLL
ncbi:hypothetical protein [Azospirillum thermophilum]|uniref:hypothetical protein n=1 Tax=Azospirillum thermophilum TaxID=2202148 RepID=UPI0015E8E9C5|nr:hypothetical protein [Azospirillum thermophilum]